MIPARPYGYPCSEGSSPSPQGVYLPFGNRKEEMKVWKKLIAVLLSCGLVIVLGLAGCGDDEHGGSLSAEDAFKYFTENCDENDFMADIETLSRCLDDCAEEDERCKAVCYNDYNAHTWSRGYWCSLAYLTMWLAGDE
jgi:hypothetical protein